MGYSVLRYVIIAFLFYQGAFAKNLPNYISVCHRNSPKLSQCFKEILQSLGPHLADGIPEFQIPPISQLVVPVIHIGEMASSSIKLNVTLKNVKLRGLEAYDVKDAKINLDDLSLSYQLHFQELELDCINAAKGKFLFMDLDGEATTVAQNKDVTATCDWKGEKYSKDGKEHLKFAIKSQSSTVGNYVVDAKGFFKQNPKLDENFNQMIKDNADLLRPDAEYYMAEVVCATFTAFQNQVLSLFSLEQLFPSN